MLLGMYAHIEVTRPHLGCVFRLVVLVQKLDMPRDNLLRIDASSVLFKVAALSAVFEAYPNFCWSSSTSASSAATLASVYYASMLAVRKNRREAKVLLLRKTRASCAICSVSCLMWMKLKVEAKTRAPQGTAPAVPLGMMQCCSLVTTAMPSLAAGCAYQ
jgi:hypothetical protein